MKIVVTGWDHIFGPWLAEKTDGSWSRERGPVIGLFEKGRGIAGAVQFTDHNGASVLLHAAGEGKRWLNREFLWFIFFYSFCQLGVKKIISPVESTNQDSIRFITSIGFDLEATLKDASPKGDLLLFTMTQDNCRWLSLRNKYRGQAQGS